MHDVQQNLFSAFETCSSEEHCAAPRGPDPGFQRLVKGTDWILTQYMCLTDPIIYLKKISNGEKHCSDLNVRKSPLSFAGWIPVDISSALAKMQTQKQQSFGI